MRLKVLRMGEAQYPPDTYRYQDLDNPHAGFLYARKVEGAFFLCEENQIDNASSVGRWAGDAATIRKFAAEIFSARRSKRVAERSPQLSLFQETAL